MNIAPGAVPSTRLKASLHPPTAQAVSRVCLRGHALCVTCDWVGKTERPALLGPSSVLSTQQPGHSSGHSDLF